MQQPLQETLSPQKFPDNYGLIGDNDNIKPIIRTSAGRVTEGSNKRVNNCG